MVTKWDHIKYNFLDHINNNAVNNFMNFHNSLKNLATETKGDFFEYFCKLFFVIDPITKKMYKKIYLYTEIPNKIKKELCLPTKDKGIDGIAIDCNNKIFAIQVKYRSNLQIKIPFGNLSTFPALLFGTNVKIDYGIYFSNCYDCCNELKNDKYIHILFESLNTKCGRLFWQNVREYIGENKMTKYIPLTMLPHQKRIVDICKKYFIEENKGRLYLACGTGKTFLGYWLSVREFKYDKIFIVVPSLYLLSQTYETWIRETQNDEYKYHYILIGSDMDDKNGLSQEYRPTTNENEIENDMKNKKYKQKIIVICTYHSSELLISVCNKLKYKFDFGIYDEAHRTTGEENKCFTNLVKSDIENKKLFMTATEKLCKTYINEKKILSMDNEDIYGKVIYRYSIRQAIEDNVLTDYRLVAPFINSNKNTNMMFNKNHDEIFLNDNGKKYDIQLILTGLMIISCMEEYNFKHLLIFSNINEKAKLIIDFIENYIDKSNHNLKEILYCKYLSGNDNMNVRKKEISEFERSKIGIISSARIFGEGIDIKICDAVCFADNKSSSIDIIQYVGRCLRKCITKPDKLSHILIPFVLNDENDFFDPNDESYLKLRKILKIIGSTDDMVTEKINIYDCNKNNYVGSLYGDNIRYDNGCEIDINKFTKNLITKIFERNGDSIDRTRNMIICENKKRYNNGDELIDTKKKCEQYFKSMNDKIGQQNIRNWVRYCLGEKLFKKICEQYCYNLEEFKKICFDNGIKNFEDYISKYNKLKKNFLPPPEYICSGYYTDLDDKFNVHYLLNENTYDDIDIDIENDY